MNQVVLQPANSTVIAAFGYVPNKGCFVQMHPSPKTPELPGKVYRYAKVGPGDFAAFDAAESKGSHYARVIKAEFGPGELVDIEISGSKADVEVGVP